MVTMFRTKIMTTTNKNGLRYLFCLLFLFVFSIPTFSQFDTNKIDSLHSASKSMIQDLKYKTLSRRGDFALNDLPNERGYLVYFDSIGDVKKVQWKDYDTTGEGNADFFLSNNVVKYIVDLFYSGMNPGISMTKSFTDKGDFVKIHFIARDDDSSDYRLIEEFRTVGGYSDANFVYQRKAEYQTFDSINSLQMLKNIMVSIPLESWDFKNSLDDILIRFVDPEIGDVTTFIDNETAIYARDSKVSKVVCTNDARTIIKILEKKQNWYKVKIYDYSNVSNMEGYVPIEDIMPVEKLKNEKQ